MRIFKKKAPFVCLFVVLKFFILNRLVSLTALSTEFDMVEPKLFSGESAQLHIEAGRHPFMQLVVDSFHPTDTSLGGDNNGSQRINIITGPNASGKSVYIKVIEYYYFFICVFIHLFLLDFI